MICNTDANPTQYNRDHQTPTTNNHVCLVCDASYRPEGLLVKTNDKFNNVRFLSILISKNDLYFNTCNADDSSRIIFHIRYLLINLVVIILTYYVLHDL